MNDVSTDVIKKAATGDKEAFEEIYSVFAGYVYNVALKITGRAEEAEEVTQDVFLSLYRNLWKFNFKSSLKTWIYRVTVNMSINSYRKNMRKKEVNMEPEKLDYFAAAETGKSSFDRDIILRKMLGVLTMDERTCLVLREIQGFSYNEISSVLKININTVRTRLKRARARLMGIYNKEKCYEM